MQKLNAAIVGLGIGEQHLISILENKSCRLSRICDLDSSKMNEMIAKYSLVDVKKSSFDDIVNDPEIHFVSIASYDQDHYEQTMQSLSKKKHVFVEKPLCQNAQQLKHISDEYKVCKKLIASNLVLRSSPLFKYVKELIDAGKFGDIYAFDGDYLYGRLNKITEGWRKDVVNYSVMQGGGIHMIDLMLWLTDQKPTSVSSKKSKIVTKDSNFKYADFHSSTFSFSSGLIGRITANFGSMHPHQHVVRIFGTHSTFIYDDRGARIHWSRREEERVEEILLSPKPVKKGSLIHNFVDHILKNESSSTVNEFDLMSAVLAADRENSDGRPTNIEYIT